MRILSERLPASKFVVFSGFDDFEYAKQAVGLNVSEYILKPTTPRGYGRFAKAPGAAGCRADGAAERGTAAQPVRREPAVLREPVLYPAAGGTRPRRAGISKSGPAGYRPLGPGLDGVPGAHRRRQRGADGPVPVQQLLEEHLKSEGCFNRVFLYNDSVAVLTAFSGAVSIYDYISAVDRVCSLRKITWD